MGRLISNTPVLPARDVAQTVSFWREELGFAEVYSGADYGVVTRDGIQVHFWGPADVDPLENDAGCRLGVDDIDSFYDEYREHVFAELGPKPWGTREFAVLDPNRNLIWLVERD
jgi:catechol 2,3-dioxygenase-like lactoylglutathione lyase family enzyme